MGYYSGDKNWSENIYQFETTDVLQGGPDGKDNQPLKELADRTVYLKNIAAGYESITIVTGAKNLTREEIVRKIVVLDCTSNVNINIPNLTQNDAGHIVEVMSISSIQLQINLTAFLAFGGSVNRNKINISNTERFKVLWTGNSWKLLSFEGNFYDVGDVFHAYRQKLNSVVADGNLLSRLTYPRLFEWIQSLDSGSIVSESIWNNTAGMKGFFTLGTNNSNFRVPDLRSMFIRGLDLGAGISTGRNTEKPGGYEADEFKSHDHDYEKSRANGSASGAADHHPDGPILTGKTSKTGGSETRPKNIGLIPLIKI